MKNKLYTEEQVREAIRLIYSLPNKTYSEQIANVLSKLTPIELPSDEEIKTHSAQKAMIENPLVQGICMHYFNLGADYVINNIQGGSK